MCVPSFGAVQIGCHLGNGILKNPPILSHFDYVALSLPINALVPSFPVSADSIYPDKFIRLFADLAYTPFMFVLAMP